MPPKKSNKEVDDMFKMMVDTGMERDSKAIYKCQATKCASDVNALRQKTKDALDKDPKNFMKLVENAKETLDRCNFDKCNMETTNGIKSQLKFLKAVCKNNEKNKALCDSSLHSMMIHSEPLTFEQTTQQQALYKKFQAAFKH